MSVSTPVTVFFMHVDSMHVDSMHVGSIRCMVIVCKLLKCKLVSCACIKMYCKTGSLCTGILTQITPHTIHVHNMSAVMWWCMSLVCIGVDLGGPADESTLMDKNPPLGGFLAKLSVPLQVSDREECV